MDAEGMDRVVSPADPEKMVLAAEGRREKLAMIRGSLSRLELVVLDMMLRGYSGREIAAVLGMNPATVRTRLARGREKLREYFNERGVGCADPNL